MLGLILGAASLAVGIGKEIAGHAAQKKAAKANAAAAIASRNQSLSQLSLQESQQTDATAQTIDQINRQALTNDAVARVSAGESGVSGASVDALINDLGAQASSAKLVAKRNLDMTIAQIQAQKKGVAAEAQNRINGVPQPSLLGTGLSILGEGLDFASARISKKAP